MASVQAEGSSCLVDDLDCVNHDKLGMEAIKSLHRQLDDDEDGDIDLSESNDVSLVSLLPPQKKWFVCFLSLNPFLPILCSTFKNKCLCSKFLFIHIYPTQPIHSSTQLLLCVTSIILM